MRLGKGGFDNIVAILGRCRSVEELDESGLVTFVEFFPFPRRLKNDKTINEIEK